ncbi:hypothetical protein F7725_023718 [Dissostichus mawsoni]|uniref:Ig-like domain-containing protein n=1 Tax=Dissostichus mawsoni TaxID=36200 RepID=A0A7J5XZ31_DISMA|nr:hypothetical protein F7725_023718 [Dissostichus mawsoni]
MIIALHVHLITKTFVLDDPPVDLTHNRDNILLDKVTGRLAMEKMTKDDEGCCVFSLLVLASLRSASTEEHFIKEGGSVTLELRPAPSGPITIIQWKFQDSILAEWVKDVLPLTHNRENIFLDKVTGRLAMEKMTKAEEDVPKPKIWILVSEKESDPLPNRLLPESSGEGYEVVLIKVVPKPSIWVSPLTCSPESDQCTLTCEGNTTGVEPVTYSWKIGDGNWTESERDMIVIKGEHGHLKTFTCKMKNPVSEEESAAHMILFLPADSGLWIKVLGAVMRSLALLALLGVRQHLTGQSHWTFAMEKMTKDDEGVYSVEINNKV